MDIRNQFCIDRLEECELFLNWYKEHNTVKDIDDDLDRCLYNIKKVIEQLTMDDEQELSPETFHDRITRILKKANILSA